ncbi:two-component sensor histidine kinase [Methylosinus sp. C49]|uniref:sensor histidine kinase n=1 Tax=Methylosinus sp. C49 TaxID=2699395 RepID=UPI001366D8A4|nr:HAMP domain-containing sensor histidine kinase [Methylosinus sp. C49]BBU63700.1 two-component sensor histidine kinase [Methylosinus sp. C49]
MRRWSLSTRLLRTLVVTQISAFAIGWFVSIFLDHYGVVGFSYDALKFYAIMRARELVIASLTRDEGGFVRIEASAALQREIERNPGLRFAVFDPEKELVASGSSPELARSFSALLPYKPHWIEFTLPGRDGRAVMEDGETPMGRLQVVVYGYKGHWTDLVIGFLKQSWGHIYYLVTPLVLSVPVMWLAVRRELRPIREFTAGLTGIDLNSLHQRLPERNYPDELAPLVRTTNETLARLDDGAMTLRRFTANAAHELRTPVAILSARLDAPEEPTLKTDLKRDARRIRNIVEQLLAISRIGARAEDAFEELDLVETARAIVSDALLLAYRSNRQIDFVAPAGTVAIHGDRMAIESVLSNVIDNALRAEPSGGMIAVTVDAGPSVAVADHGEGVAAMDREFVFEPFWRKTTMAPGTGLGLAIARELMTIHGGRIWIEDTPGGGATFRLAFPLATIDAGRATT